MPAQATAAAGGNPEQQQRAALLHVPEGCDRMLLQGLIDGLDMLGAKKVERLSEKFTVVPRFEQSRVGHCSDESSDDELERVGKTRLKGRAKHSHELGRGGFAKCVKCVSREGGGPKRACKVIRFSRVAPLRIHPEGSQNWKRETESAQRALQHLFAEIACLQILDHPNMSRIIQGGLLYNHKKLFIVLELIAAPIPDPLTRIAHIYLRHKPENVGKVDEVLGEIKDAAKESGGLSSEDVEDDEKLNEYIDKTNKMESLAVKLGGSARRAEMPTACDLLEMINANYSTGIPDCYTSIVCRDTLKAIEYLHNQSIAHRDLKPENLFVCLHRKAHLKRNEEGKITGCIIFEHVKGIVLDLGLCKLAALAKMPEPDPESGLQRYPALPTAAEIDSHLKYVTQGSRQRKEQRTQEEEKEDEEKSKLAEIAQQRYLERQAEHREVLRKALENRDKAHKSAGTTSDGSNNDKRGELERQAQRELAAAAAVALPAADRQTQQHEAQAAVSTTNNNNSNNNNNTTTTQPEQQQGGEQVESQAGMQDVEFSQENIESLKQPEENNNSSSTASGNNNNSQQSEEERQRWQQERQKALENKARDKMLQSGGEQQQQQQQDFFSSEPSQEGGGENVNQQEQEQEQQRNHALDLAGAQILMTAGSGTPTFVAFNSLMAKTLPQRWTTDIESILALDIWSIGVIAFCCSICYHPFAPGNPTPQSIMSLIQHWESMKSDPKRKLEHCKTLAKGRTFSQIVYDFFCLLLHKNAKDCPSASAALQHNFVRHSSSIVVTEWDLPSQQGQQQAVRPIVRLMRRPEDLGQQRQNVAVAAATSTVAASAAASATPSGIVTAGPGVSFVGDVIVTPTTTNNNNNTSYGQRQRQEPSALSCEPNDSVFPSASSESQQQGAGGGGGLLQALQSASAEEQVMVGATSSAAAIDSLYSGTYLEAYPNQVGAGGAGGGEGGSQEHPESVGRSGGDEEPATQQLLEATSTPNSGNRATLNQQFDALNILMRGGEKKGGDDEDDGGETKKEEEEGEKKK